jgi:di/tricarboxylate transporter
MATADNLGVDFMPFVIVTMVAASASFATPLGYQTNLMVYGPGGYRFSDYLRIGLPLDILVGGTAVLITPLAWPL